MCAAHIQCNESATYDRKDPEVVVVKNKYIWVEVPAGIQTPFDLMSLNKFIQCLYSQARFLKKRMFSSYLSLS